MKRLMRIIFGVILMGTGVARGETVRLMARSVVTDGTVRLGNIATIDDATPAMKERLAQTVVVEKLDGARAIRAEEVLFAVLQQNKDLGLAATLVIRGAAQCSVASEGLGNDSAAAGNAKPADVNTLEHRRDADATLSAAANRAADVSQEAVAEQPREQVRVDQKAEILPAAAVGSLVKGSLAEQITRQVIRDFGVPADEIMVDFTTADASILAAPPAGETWTFHSTMRPSLGTMQWEAKLLNGTLPIKDIWVQAMVKRRATQVVTTADLQHGTLVTADALKAQVVWLDRQMPDVATDPKELVGMEVMRSMAAGTPVNRRDFQISDAAQQNDLVTVYFVAGAVKVKSTAKAMQRGRLGDQITIQNDNKETFQATLIDHRLAVVGAVDAATLKQLREHP